VQHIQHLQSYIDTFRSLLGKGDKPAHGTIGQIVDPPLRNHLAANGAGMNPLLQEEGLSAKRGRGNNMLSAKRSAAPVDHRSQQQNQQQRVCKDPQQQQLHAPRKRGNSPSVAVSRATSPGIANGRDQAVAQGRRSHSPPASTSGPPRTATTRANRSVNGNEQLEVPAQSTRRVFRQSQAGGVTNGSAGPATPVPELSPSSSRAGLSRNSSQQAFQSRAEVNDSTFDTTRRTSSGGTFSKAATDRRPMCRSTSPGHYLGQTSMLGNKNVASFGKSARNTTRSLLAMTSGRDGPGVGRYSPPPRKEIASGGTFDRTQRWKPKEEVTRGGPGPTTYRPRVHVLSTFGKGDN
jgi:hypothetical protein